MAFKWFDGVDYTSNSAMLASLGYWDITQWSIDVGAGRFGGNAFAGGGGGTAAVTTLTRALDAPLGEAFFGQAVNAPVGVLKWGFSDLANANKMQCYLSLDDYGVISAWQGDIGAGTALGASTPNSWLPGTWNYIETHVVIAAANGGTIEVKVNGKSVLSLPGVTTQLSADASFGGIRWQGVRNTTILVDDLYLCDATGEAPFDTWLGNVRAQVLLAAGAGGATQFTPSDGSKANWQCAANQAVDDTLYVADATVGDEDLYAVTRAIGAVPVLAVQARGAYRQDDATQRQAQTLLKSGTAFADTSAVPCTQSYAFQTDGPFVTDPATGNGWTPDGVNNLQIGPKVAA